MENNNVGILDDDTVATVGGGKREKVTLPSVESICAGQVMPALAEEMGMSDYKVTSTSYVDDHDDEKPYKTVELEIKASCPLSNLKENNDFKLWFNE